MKRRNFINMSFCGMAAIPYSNTINWNRNTKQKNQTCVSLAYWKDSETIEQLDQITNLDFIFDVEKLNPDILLERFPLVAAESQLDCDDQFIQRGAKVGIHGIIPSQQNNNNNYADLISASVNINFNPYHEIVFNAWHYENRYVSNLGSPISFSTCIHKDFGFNFSIQTQTTSGGENESKETNFCLTADPESTMIKLRRGVYIAMIYNSKMTGILDLRNYSIVIANPDRALEEPVQYVMLNNSTGIMPSGIACIVLTMDYEKEKSDEVLV